MMIPIRSHLWLELLRCLLVATASTLVRMRLLTYYETHGARCLQMCNELAYLLQDNKALWLDLLFCSVSIRRIRGLGGKPPF